MGRGSKRRILEDPAHVLGTLKILEPGDIGSVDRHPSNVRFDGPRDDIEQRGLPRTVGTNHRDELAVLKAEVDV